jgi:hypothetical protein
MGLNPSSMPSANRPPACPVPDGLIEGGDGGTLALAAADHRLEQECLFYVALSRARDRLNLYSASRDAGGRRRNPSPFVARIGPVEARTAATNRDRPIDPETAPLPITLARPIMISAAQLELYTRCPRRFLYTHVLQTGGRRTPTALTMMHDLVRSVVGELALMEPSDHPVERIREIFGAAWAAGPLADADHELHRDVAALLVERFAASRSGGVRQIGTDMTAAIDGGVIVARADDVVRTGGATVARVVRTGHSMSKSGRSLADAAFLIAAAASLPGCMVELLHLSDDQPALAVAFDPRALGRHREELTAALAAICDGRFEPERSDRTCPSCPAFFICGPLAPGPLEKNLRA